MKKKLITSFFLLPFFTNGQSCNLTLLNHRNEAIQFDVKKGDLTLFTSNLDGKLGVRNIEELRNTEIELWFHNRKLYKAYHTGWYIKQGTSTSDEHLSYKQTGLSEVCSNINNTYYIRLKERRLEDIPIKK